MLWCCTARLSPSAPRTARVRCSRASIRRCGRRSAARSSSTSTRRSALSSVRRPGPAPTQEPGGADPAPRGADPADPAIRVVGMIGAGRIGQPIIGHLVRRGFTVFAHDADAGKREAIEQRGATWATLPEIASHAQAVLVCVGYDRELRDLIANGLVDRLSPGTILAVLSTVNPATVQEPAELARPPGIPGVPATMGRAGRAPHPGPEHAARAGDPGR